jgi:hypothetical protein
LGGGAISQLTIAVIPPAINIIIIGNGAGMGVPGRDRFDIGQISAVIVARGGRAF